MVGLVAGGEAGGVEGLGCGEGGPAGRVFYRMRGHRLRPGARRAMTEADYAALITAAHRYLGPTGLTVEPEPP